MPIYRVLIVDDSAFMRKVFSDRIDADDDFTVAATASDGEEAVRLALSHKPDIITMDLEMPRMNGIDALREIMAARPTPVIMLSAITDNGTRDTIRALQYGAFDFIHKPDSSVKQGIRQVGDELLDKLRIAMESVKRGTFRMLPAVEDEGLPEQPPPRPTIGGLPEPPEISEPMPEPERPEFAEAMDTAPATPPHPAASGAEGPAGTAIRLEPAAGSPPTPVKPTSKSGARPPGGDTRGRAPQRAPLTASSAPSAPSRAVSQARQKPEESAAAAERKPFRPLSTFSQIVAIGTSTGGPRALHEVLTGLPADFEAPVLIVQHMPAKFTSSLAQRLDSFCSLRVREATEGEKLETATAYIAPGGKQMSVNRESSGTYRIKLTEEGPRSGHMPSVDVLFDSLVGHRQLKRHIVLMTGMGSDGAKGMKALQEDGAETLIGEAEETCVVYGMPRSAFELGAVTHQIPLQRIAPLLVHEVKSRNQ